MSQFTDIIKIINCMPPEMAAKMKRRMMGNPQEVEDAVLKWDKDHRSGHPYPTWHVWLREIGVIAESTGKNGVVLRWFTDKFEQDIDAEMAEKLGIKPRVEKG